MVIENKHCLQAGLFFGRRIEKFLNIGYSETFYSSDGILIGEIERVGLSADSDFLSIRADNCGIQIHGLEIF